MHVGIQVVQCRQTAQRLQRFALIAALQEGLCGNPVALLCFLRPLFFLEPGDGQHPIRILFAQLAHLAEHQNGLGAIVSLCVLVEQVPVTLQRPVLMILPHVEVSHDFSYRVVVGILFPGSQVLFDSRVEPVLLEVFLGFFQALGDIRHGTPRQWRVGLRKSF